MFAPKKGVTSVIAWICTRLYTLYLFTDVLCHQLTVVCEPNCLSGFTPL